jgi:hypothetical protein
MLLRRPVSRPGSAWINSGSAPRPRFTFICNPVVAVAAGLLLHAILQNEI